MEKTSGMGSYTAMTKIDDRIQELGITLPAPPVPVASYVPYVISGKLVVISGQIPLGPEGPTFIGKLGADLSLEDGQAAARLCALNLLAQLKAACGGDLDKVTGKRCTFMAFPWRWTEGCGSGVRVVAIVDPKQEYRIETGK